jgi:hypothetical protein
MPCVSALSTLRSVVTGGWPAGVSLCVIVISSGASESFLSVHEKSQVDKKIPGAGERLCGR